MLERSKKLELELQDVEEEIDREASFQHASSFIGEVTYTPDFQSLEIVINGRSYPYCNVPQRIYDSFKSAGSKGRFFNRAIKGIYEC